MKGFSDRQIAEWCGVSPQSVANARPEVKQVPNLGTSTRKGRDGKSYPVPRNERKAKGKGHSEDLDRLCRQGRLPFVQAPWTC